jgi:hypothetical protein
MLGATLAQAGSPVAVPANMLPQGGHFVAGAGSIGTQGLTETITQSSQRGIIDFNSFSIGKSGTVKINNGAGATLNRVTGGNLSQIMGTQSDWQACRVQLDLYRNMPCAGRSLSIGERLARGSAGDSQCACVAKSIWVRASETERGFWPDGH